MSIIERLNNPETCIDAVDDAIDMILRLQDTIARAPKPSYRNYASGAELAKTVMAWNRKYLEWHDDATKIMEAK